jgi:hypothetical protein
MCYIQQSITFFIYLTVWLGFLEVICKQLLNKLLNLVDLSNYIEKKLGFCFEVKFVIKLSNTNFVKVLVSLNQVFF